MRQVTVIYNPAAGAHRAQRLATKHAEILASLGLDVDLQPTTAPGNATLLAAEAARNGTWAVFACGGDGNLRECAAGLLGSQTALGFLPSGTANVMRRVIGLPRRDLDVAAALAHGVAIDFDVGICNDQPFLMQASVGLDAAALDGAVSTRKRRFGRLEIARAAMSAWLSYAFPEFEVSSGDRRQKVSFAVIANIPFYGGGWRIAPDAAWDDGELDMVTLGSIGRAATLGFARDLAFGRHLEREDVECERVREVTIDEAAGLCLQLDGDSMPGQLPARIRLSDRRLRLLVPNNSAL